MKKILNKKFNKKIQKKLNKLFLDEQYHAYTLGELLKLIGLNILIITVIVIVSAL